MNFKTKLTGIIRYYSLIFVILLAHPLAGQQTGSAPVMTLIGPSVADSLDNSGVTLVRAEIISHSALQTFRIIHRPVRQK